MCDYNWDLADATVVCHQLGYLRAVGAPRYAAFGAGSGPSWYSNVSCVGTEMNLTECSKFSALGSACPHYQDAGVVCSSELQIGPLRFCLLYSHCVLEGLHSVFLVQSTMPFRVDQW